MYRSCESEASAWRRFDAIPTTIFPPETGAGCAGCEREGWTLADNTKRRTANTPHRTFEDRPIFTVLFPIERGNLADDVVDVGVSEAGIHGQREILLGEAFRDGEIAFLEAVSGPRDSIQMVGRRVRRLGFHVLAQVETQLVSLRRANDIPPVGVARVVLLCRR